MWKLFLQLFMFDTFATDCHAKVRTVTFETRSHPLRELLRCCRRLIGRDSFFGLKHTWCTLRDPWLQRPFNTSGSMHGKLLHYVFTRRKACGFVADGSKLSVWEPRDFAEQKVHW